MRAEAEKGLRKGFTLVEIVIVLAILGILVAVSASTFREIADRYRVESETKKMFADLMDIRARAMQRNRVAFVRLLASGYETYEDTSPAPDGNGTLETAADTRSVNVALKHAVAPTLAGTITVGGAPTFWFDRSGISSIDNTGYIRLTSSNGPDYDCIVIGPTRVKMGQFSGGACVEK